MRYLFALLVAGCGAQWTEAPKALDPVSQNLFPVAGSTLIGLSASFHQLCPEGRATSSDCAKAADELNAAIDRYNEANDLILENY